MLSLTSPTARRGFILASIIGMIVVLTIMIGFPGEGRNGMIHVQNASFEQPGDGKILNDWARVPGWSSDGVATTNSGLEVSSHATEGNYLLFLSHQDQTGVMQRTGHRLKIGDIITLSVDALTTYAAGDGGPAVLELALATPNRVSNEVLAQRTFPTTTRPATYAMVFTVDRDLQTIEGKPLVIIIRNANPEPENFLGVDNVTLTIE